MLRMEHNVKGLTIVALAAAGFYAGLDARGNSVARILAGMRWSIGAGMIATALVLTLGACGSDDDSAERQEDRIATSRVVPIPTATPLPAVAVSMDVESDIRYKGADLGGYHQGWRYTRCIEYALAGVKAEKCWNHFTLVTADGGILRVREHAERAGIPLSVWDANEEQTKRIVSCWDQAEVGLPLPKCWLDPELLR